LGGPRPPHPPDRKKRKKRKGQKEKKREAQRIFFSFLPDFFKKNKNRLCYPHQQAVFDLWIGILNKAGFLHFVKF